MFRIRNNNSDNLERERICEKSYRQHLNKFSKSSNTDLWKYFCLDFFHDGYIEKITLEQDLKTVSFRLDCPNIKRYANDDYEFVSASFECIFTGVSNFNVYYENPQMAAELSKYASQFLFSEINTSPVLETMGKEDCYSILIQLLAGDDVVWMELVFNQVHVIADEPLSFARMESDPAFKIPTYSDKKNGSVD